MEILKVIKRDGRIKDFEETRIIEAIEKAYIELGREEYFLTDISMGLVDKIKNDIGMRKIDNQISIEVIQDVIENILIEFDKNVCKAYSTYRKNRDDIRVKKSQKERFYNEVLECSNIDNDNANVDQYSFSGKKQRISEYEQKNYALRNLISAEGKKAFEEGSVYYHDLASYATGEHNCSFADLDGALNNGFVTRNGDVRTANSYATACQLIAVVFQCQSQVQFGGIASNHLDFTLAEFVKRSFKIHFKDGLFEKYYTSIKDLNIDDKHIYIDNKGLENEYKEAYDYAIRKLKREGKQASEGLYHNLNTLESRAGSQLPFTSINYGRDISSEGRLVNKWILDASLEGIGKNHRTSIFPIGIFQYKKGTNAKIGEPNYDLKLKAIEALSKRIYPNIVNGDWKKNIEDPNNPDTFMATMGCRTIVGYDIHTDSYIKTGRGNISPMTIILPKLGLDYGIALGKREFADLKGFERALDDVLVLVRSELIIRQDYISKQSPKSAPFIYKNNVMMGADKVVDTVEECIKHGSNAIGIIGMAECCVALFGKHHGESVEAYEFALKMVEKIYNFCEKSTREYKRNFSTYFTPSENLCKTARNTLEIYYGDVKGVTDRPYLTNSIHIPVWHKIDAYSKLTLEAPFTQYGTGGCITYIELDSAAINNLKGLEKIIDYAMDINIPYLAVNFPIDTCTDCGYASQINTELCPVCGSENIERLKRVTGYLTTDYRNFNAGKFAEANDRVKHIEFNPEVIPILECAKEKLKGLGIEIPQNTL